MSETWLPSAESYCTIGQRNHSQKTQENGLWLSRLLSDNNIVVQNICDWTYEKTMLMRECGVTSPSLEASMKKGE